jgi:hypothetical protein
MILEVNIMKKHILFLMIFLFFASVAVSANPIPESIIVRNFTSQDIIITREYRDDPTKEFYVPETRSWSQRINGFYIDFSDLFLEINEIRVQPNRETFILSMVVYTIESRERLAQIPFMDIMRNVYQTLRIATEDGSKVITLENLGEQTIKRLIRPDGLPSSTYIIEIFDNNRGNIIDQRYESRLGNNWR